MKVLSTLLLLVFALSSFGQRANPDALAKRNASLEILLLEYKEQLQKANKNIKRLYAENARIKYEIDALMSKKNKEQSDINRIMSERSKLLHNKNELESTLKLRETTIKLLEEANRKLKEDNAMLKSNNAILEEAKMMADTIQQYQEKTIKKQEASIKELSINYGQKCSELTGQYKTPLTKNSLNVLLDGSEKGPNNKFIESLTVSACFQIPDTKAKNKVIVYFTLYEQDTRKAVRRIRFSVPKTKVSSNGSYYEGTHKINTKSQLQLKDNAQYFYEITYKESVISKGIIKSS